MAILRPLKSEYNYGFSQELIEASCRNALKILEMMSKDPKQPMICNMMDAADKCFLGKHTMTKIAWNKDYPTLEKWTGKQKVFSVLYAYLDQMYGFQSKEQSIYWKSNNYQEFKSLVSEICNNLLERKVIICYSMYIDPMTKKRIDRDPIAIRNGTIEIPEEQYA